MTFADVTTSGACAGSYSVTRTWTATDACGNSSTASQTINVQDVTAPVIDALPAASTINCPATPVFAVATATDGCGSAFTLASSDVTTPGACAGSYSVTRTWTATDGCGNSSTASQTINVQDVTAPVFTSVPSDVTATCTNIPGPGTPAASDNCSSATISSPVKSVAAADCSGNVVITYTWTATDACGNAATASQHITYNEITCKYTTVTQGGWGAKPSGNNWGAYLTYGTRFATAFPNGLVIGNASGAKSIKLTSASAVQGFLPNSGTPRALTNATQLVNPASKTVANTLAGQTAALPQHLL